MSKDENEVLDEELDIDDAIAIALASAIASRSGNGKEHALYITANLLLHVNAIYGTSIPDFLKVLKNVNDSVDFSKVEVIRQGVDIDEYTPDEDSLPAQNAPGSNEVN